MQFFSSSSVNDDDDFTATPAPPGTALVFTLRAMDRSETVGKPGRPSNAYITVDPTPPQQVDFSSAILMPEATTTNPWLVYGVDRAWTDTPVLVLLELPPDDKAKCYASDAFLDRSVRARVQVGSRVAVVALATVEASISEKESRELLGDDGARLSWVGNTGRCGSTLMHKLLLSAGVLSLTEPQWVDQLCKGTAYQKATDAQLERSVQACIALDAYFATKSLECFTGVSDDNDAKERIVSINPKSGGARVQAAVARAFPKARHLFMYRKCEKVVESFGAIFLKDHPPSWTTPYAWALNVFVFGPPPVPEPIEKVPGLRDALGTLSSPLAARGVAGWLLAVLGYCDVVRPALLETSSSEAVVVRMDEFVAPATRADVAKRVLAHLKVVAYDEDTVLAVFGKDSQEGSKMSRMGDPSKQKVTLLTDADRDVIRSTCLKLAFKDKMVSASMNGEKEASTTESTSTPNGGETAPLVVHFDAASGDVILAGTAGWKAPSAEK